MRKEMRDMMNMESTGATGVTSLRPGRCNRAENHRVGRSHDLILLEIFGMRETQSTIAVDQSLWA